MEFNNNWIVSGNGPLLEVYEKQNRQIADCSQVATIHCFDSLKTNVQHVFPLGELGCVVAGGCYLTVALEADPVLSLIWINPERIAKLSSEITKICDADLDNFTDGRMGFWAVLLHKNGSIARYSILLLVQANRTLEIKVTKRDEKILAPELLFLTVLSSSKFFAFYPDTVLLKEAGERRIKYKQSGKVLQPGESVFAFREGDEVIKISSRGTIEILRADKTMLNEEEPGDEMVILEELYLVSLFYTIGGKPLCAVAATFEENCGTEDNSLESRIRIIVGYEDGTICFNDKKQKIFAYELCDGPITSLFVDEEAGKVLYTTSWGTLSAIGIPRFKKDKPDVQEVSLKGICTRHKGWNGEFLVASCSYHHFLQPCTAFLTVGFDIRIYVTNEDSSCDNGASGWKKERDYKSCSLTVFPHDLYRTTNPRLLMAFSSETTIEFRIASWEQADVPQIVLTFDDCNISKALSVHLPPPWMTRYGENIDLRMLIVAEDQISIYGLRFSESGEFETLETLCDAVSEEEISNIGCTSASFSYIPGELNANVEYVRKPGTEGIDFSPSYTVVGKVDVIDHIREQKKSPRISLREIKIDGYNCRIKANVFATICNGMSCNPEYLAVANDARRLYVKDRDTCGAVAGIGDVGLVTGISVVYVLSSHESCNLILTVSKDGKCTLALFRKRTMTLLSTQWSTVVAPVGIFAVEQTGRKMLRVLVVGRSIQTLLFCLKPLLLILNDDARRKMGMDQLIISNNPIMREGEMGGFDVKEMLRGEKRKKTGGKGKKRK